MAKVVDEILLGLGAKHKAIYLTYKAYERTGKKLPRTLLAKLRREFELSQSTIRFYKKEAHDAVTKALSEYERSKV